MNFNDKLIELRKSKGLSQDELGQRIGGIQTNHIEMGTGTKLSGFSKACPIE